jgi:hypothetical protein
MAVSAISGNGNVVPGTGLIRTPRWIFFVLFALTALAPRVHAQTPDSTWDSARVLELVERARARRLLPAQDTSLRNYTAQAEGYVYFYLDRRDTQEKTLIKTDQIALELFWGAPNRTKQRIVGLRDESRLPNRMYYHLDHLTVVQNGFGDVIRLGDGDEVRDVPHPAARRSELTYSYRLADSMSITLQGSDTPVLVYEIEVRPRNQRTSALVGSIFVDRANADIVRMTFTFTPVSYVDPRLDYISVSLENALWEGRYWLPREQTLQIRRQVPYFDFAASAIIHGRMRVLDYTFNDSLPPATFTGYPVTAVPEAEREKFEFERGLYDDLNAAGLQPPPDLETLRAQAEELLGTARLSGLPSLRLGLGSASGALRFNRAEGVAVGAGLAYVPETSWRADLAAGYAFGAEHPFGSVEVRREISNGVISARVALNEVHDLGVRPAVPGAINTLAAAFLGKDYLDPYYVDVAQLSVRRRLSDAWWWQLTAAGERHTSATLTQSASLFEDSTFRDVSLIWPGNFGYVQLSLERPVIDARADAWGTGVSLQLGNFDSDHIARATTDFTFRRSTADHNRQVLVLASAGLTLPEDKFDQLLFHIGGINTLPGYPYRSMSGLGYALLNVEGRQSLLDPWLGVRLLGAAGAAGGPIEYKTDTDPQSAALRRDGSGVSAGAGLSLFWDMLRIDAVRGFTSRGEWQLLLSFHPDFWDIS